MAFRKPISILHDVWLLSRTQSVGAASSCPASGTTY
jgi:hypothetical protein